MLTSRTMTVQDVHLLTLHEPYEAPEHPVPINATIVHALTLLHPARFRNPTVGLMYRCLTEFPHRSPGCVVPLSTLTFELDGGRGWYQIGDWQRVVEVVVELARVKRCDAMHLGLPPMAASLLSQSPHTIHHLHHSDGIRSTVVGPAERQEHLDELTDRVREFVARAPFWPGADLLSPPTHPRTMLYKPWKRPERRMNADTDRPGQRSIFGGEDETRANDPRPL